MPISDLFGSRLSLTTRRALSQTLSHGSALQAEGRRYPRPLQDGPREGSGGLTLLN